MAEAYSALELALRYYGRVLNGRIVEYGAQMPFNFELMSNTGMGTGSNGYIEYIQKWLLNLPKGDHIQANWVVSELLSSNYHFYSMILKISVEFHHS